MTVELKGAAPDVAFQESCSPVGTVARSTVTVWG
jgi:hypothetical protein